MKHDRPGSPEVSAREHLDLHDVLRIFKRRRRTILFTVLGLTAASAVVTYQLPRVYTAVAEVLIEPQATQAVDALAVVDELPPQDQGMIETQIEFLTSRSFLRRVADELQLADDPEFNPYRVRGPASADPPAGEAVALDGAVDGAPAPDPGEDAGPSLLERSIAWLKALDLPAPFQVFASDVRPARASPAEAGEAVVNRLLERLDAEQAKRAYVIDVSATARSPEQAAAIANAVAERYVAEQLQEKQSKTGRVAAWLADRVDGLRTQLIADEQQVAEYRKQHRLIETSGNSPIVSQLGDLNRHLASAQAERAAAEARHAQLRALLAEDVESVAAFLDSPLMADLRAQEAVLARVRAEQAEIYGERHPRMINLEAEFRELRQRITAEAERILDDLANEVRVAQAREEQLGARIEALGEQVSAEGEAAVQLQELERSAEATRTLYTNFLQRLKEVEEQQQIVEPGARVISSAIPPLAPSFPRPTAVIGASFAGALMLAAILAFVVESLDKAVRDGERIQRLLALRTLALVPRVGRRGKRLPLHHLVVKHPRSAYAAAIRSVHLDLALSGHDGPAPKMVLVTSGLPSEGKTTFALSLATAAAIAGYRTAIVDLDLHRPGLRKATESSVSGPDVVAYLTNRADLAGIASPDPEINNLDLLTVGEAAPDPTQLIASPRLITLLRQLRASYDFVVLDTPPVLAIKDVQILTRLADTTLLAVRWEKTTEDALLAAARMLREQRTTIAGAVITQVDLKRHARGVYADSAQYIKEYGAYYHDA